MYKPYRIVSVLLFSVLLITLITLLGCPEKKATNKKPAHGPREMTGSQSEDLFKQSIDTLNHLEDNFGTESLTHVLGRLDRWILQQNPDKSWVPDPFFTEQEKNVREIGENLKLLASQLQKLGGKATGNEAAGGEAIGAEATEGETPLSAADVRQAADTAKAVREQLVLLHQVQGVRHFLEYAQIVAGIESIVDPLATVAQTRNLGAREIRDYFNNQLRQQQTDVQKMSEGIATLVGTFSLYAETFRGDSLSFRGLDGAYLKQSFWCRNVAGWARGERQDELDRAKELFDWTIRAVMMQSRIAAPTQQPNQPPVFLPPPPQAPWEAMLYGKGNVADWANVFIELLRQQRIDACVLGMEVQTGQNLKMQVPWGVGVLIDNKIYVFLVRFGIPLAAESDVQLDPEKGLVFTKVTTLAELRANPDLLKPFVGGSLPGSSGSSPGSLTAEQADAMLKEIHLLISANPIARSQRMKIMEKALTGGDKTVLYAVYEEQKERFAKAMPDLPVQMWKYPFETNFENCLRHGKQDIRMLPFFVPTLHNQSYPLWRGRILYFAGKKTGENGATLALFHAGISDSEMQKMPQLNQEQFIVYKMSTAAANFWLSQINFEEAQEPFNAGDRTKLLNAAYSYATKLLSGGSPMGQEWSHGVLYLLARICESLGKYDEAIKYYTVPSQEPDVVGRFYRANQLKRLKTNPPEAK